MIPDGSSILDFSLRNTPSNSLHSAGAQLSHICTQLKKFQTELITFLPKLLLSICFFSWQIASPPAFLPQPEISMSV